MPISTPEIDFGRIRPYGEPASRPNAFEELASILIEQSAEWPSGTRFHRFGNPDGGREGKGVLPNGDVWAWQAKYLFAFDSSAAGQVKKSLVRSLETEPTLKRYFVALPIDLPAGDTKRVKSAFTLWGEEVEKWEALAREKGLSVEFTFVGAHQMTTSLTEPMNAGRVRYWFDSNVLTASEQQQRIDDVAAKLGRRYSPEIHVDVDAVQVIEAVGRSSGYVERWQRALAELRSARQWGWRAPEGDENVYESALSSCDTALSNADETLQRVVDSASTFDELATAEHEVTIAIDALRAVDDLLRTHSRSSGGLYVGDAATLYTNVRDARSALGAARTLCTSVATRAAKEGELLLTGRAGVGKTHLLCDAARRRIAAGQPTVMVLGQEFDGRALLTQIPELGEAAGTTDDLLSLLDAVGEASGSKALLIIDAINESERPERWPDAIRALQTKAARFRHVGLVLSCRTEFVDAVVGSNNVPAAEHYGFEEVTDIAVRRFTSEYKLELPTFPVFNPEFGNPLFLRLTCEALVTLGTSRFVLGSAGLTTICDAFIEAANARLAHPQRCDYDVKQKLVQSTIRQLAQLDGGYFDRSEVARVSSTLLPDRSWSKSLMKGLLDDGILIEVGTDRIAFGYQRLGDVARAKEITSRTLPEIRLWLQSLGRVLWRERGTLGALAIMLPEAHGVELVDLMAVDKKVPRDAIDSFLESLTLREPASISARTIDVTEHFLTTDSYAHETRTQLVRLACVPDHPLNARWLHGYLSAQELADRDTAWSVWLLGALDPDEHSPVRTLIEWAWPLDSTRSVTPDRETGTLAMLTLGWFLATSDRRVRDHATKALVALGEMDPRAFVDALVLLVGVNDPYVIERVTAAACGISLRNASATDVQAVAGVLAEFVSDGWPSHLLTRDYTRRVFDAARASGWEGPAAFPPYGAQWPIDATPREEIKKLAAPPDYLYGSIWHSLTGMGDFGKYILEPAIRDLRAPDRKAILDIAERAIFDRVRDLGWSPEKFDSIDSRLRRGRSDGPVERFGKKYQWIALYEVLGALADHFELKPEWSSDTPRPYEYPEQLIWRDIDVTLLAREPAPSPEPHWFSPATTTFPRTVVNEYPSDMIGVPDPIDLLAITSPDGERWLSLLSFPSWRQQHPLEIEALRPPTRNTWMQLHAYLVPMGAVDTLKAWAVAQDWYGRWMPDVADPANLLLGSHPTDPQWAGAAGPIDDWNSHSGGKQPTEFIQCGASYGGTGTDRDASAEHEIHGFVPSRVLFDLLGLQHGVDFIWQNDTGVAVIDPSTSEGGPNVLLLRRRLFPRLSDAGFALFWTVLVGHEHSTGDHGIPGDDYRWISASASYLLTNDIIEKIDSRASRYKPGPNKEFDIAWTTKPSDA